METKCISQQAFCDKSGIKLGTFKQDDLAGVFIELTNPSSTLGNQYEIVCPNGVILKIQNPDLQEVLSEHLIRGLKKYIEAEKPQEYLFNGQPLPNGAGGDFDNRYSQRGCNGQ